MFLYQDTSCIYRDDINCYTKCIGSECEYYPQYINRTINCTQQLNLFEVIDNEKENKIKT